MAYWRYPFRVGPSYADFAREVGATGWALPWDAAGGGLRRAAGAAFDAVLQESGFFVFSHWIVYSIVATFLLPLWSLSFATEGLGREREAGNLIWLLTRPLPRPAMYLAKFVAVLPWALGLNLGGFAVLCLAAGAPGRLAFRLYWPPVLWGTLAFCALFHLLGATLRRPAVVAILYSFFLETVFGNLPGYLKRFSISFYMRCYMFDRAHAFGARPERPEVFLPVSGGTAWLVLAGLTVVLVALGMMVFSRREYLDLA
jgi:ABC-type transport system involved in multi-copper enzyme maturation permease subunit